MYDLVIEGGLVFDGSLRPPQPQDVAILVDRIAGVGDFRAAPARRRIQAQGLAVAPGFVDVHTHSDIALISLPLAESAIRQGVTTVVVGNCGMSPAPLARGMQDGVRRALSFLDVPSVAWEWTSMADYLLRLRAARPSVNVAALVGHGTLRAAVMGFAQRPATADELVRLEALLEQSLAAGAIGLSTGLVYSPGMYAATGELVSLARVVARHGGVYTTHLRSERRGLFDALEEAITIGREAGVAIQISHLKLGGLFNRGKARDAIGLIERARAAGVRVGCDVYPYEAGSTMLATLLPPWAHAGGPAALLERLRDPGVRDRLAVEVVQGLPGWDSLIEGGAWDRVVALALRAEPNRRLEGLTLMEIAHARGVRPVDALCDILLAERGAGNMIIYHSQTEDMEEVLRYANASIASDSAASGAHGVPGGGRPHPRCFGTFPRVLGHMVRERRLLSLVEAIHRMTSLPAAQLGLPGRGTIARGAFADLVLFDPDRVADTATYDDPYRYPEGIEAVIVNGRPTVRGGNHTGERAGQVWFRGQWSAAPAS